MTTTTATHDHAERARRRRDEPLYRLEGHFTQIVPVGPTADGFRLNGHFAGTLTFGDLAGATLTGIDYFRIRDDGAGVVRAHEVVTLGEQVVTVELHGLLLPPEGIDAPRPADIVQPGFAWPEAPYTVHVSATFETAAPASPSSTAPSSPTPAR